MSSATIQGLTNGPESKGTPAETMHLIKKLEDAILETTKEIQFLSEMEALTETVLTEEQTASFVAKFSTLKRFQNEPEMAHKFVKSLAESKTTREIIFQEEKRKLLEFNKHFEDDLTILTSEYEKDSTLYTERGNLTSAEQEKPLTTTTD